MTELEAMRVRLDAARIMLRAALDLLAVADADLLIEPGAAVRSPSTIAKHDPRASVGAGNLRD